jgi:hypothetical protein
MTDPVLPTYRMLGELLHSEQPPITNRFLERGATAIPQSAYPTLLGFAAWADRSTPTTGDDWRKRHLAWLDDLYADDDSERLRLRDLLQSQANVMVFSSRAALRVAQYVMVFGDLSATPPEDDENEACQLMRKLLDLIMRLDHAWGSRDSPVTLRSEDRLRSFQRAAFHSTGPIVVEESPGV